MPITSRTHYRVSFAVLTAGVGTFALLQSLVVPVLTTVQEELHTTQTAVTWVLTAYLLSASIFTPIMGRIGDMVGKERVYVAALVALAIGSLLAAVATNVEMMIFARIIQGVGGGVMPLAFGIIRDEFPEHKVNGAIGSLASLTAVGAGLGIVLAGPIMNVLNYHWLFWLPMIMAVVAAIAAMVLIPESPIRSPGRISVTPAILLSGWLVFLLVAVSKAPTWGWGSAQVLGLLAGAVLLAAAWVRSETRAVTPLIDLTMMRLPVVWTNNLVALLLGMGMYATFAFIPEFVQTPSSAGYGFGASITESGLIMLPSAIASFVIGQLVGRLVVRFGGRTLVITGCLIGAAALLMLTLAHDHIWQLYVSGALQGVGFGLVFSAMSGLVVAAVSPEQTSVATGMNANIRTIGGAFGAAVMASIVTSNLRPDGVPDEAGFTLGFAILAGGLVLAALAGLLIPRGVNRRSDTAAERLGGFALAPQDA